MSKNQHRIDPGPQPITDQDVAAATRALATSVPQALWAVFGQAYDHLDLFRSTLAQSGMRAALEAVAQANASASVTSTAREAAALYSNRTRCVTAYTACELGAWEDVVRLVLERARVTL